MYHALHDPASGTGAVLRGASASLTRILEATAAHAGAAGAARAELEARAVLCHDSLLVPPAERTGVYDIVITNPPFNGVTDEATAAGGGGTLRTKKTELLFVDAVLTSLRQGGRACVLVPAGVLFGSGKAHVELRRTLVEENDLEAVIHVPAGAFKPYAGSATNIVRFRKGKPVTQRVWFDEITALGYTLDNKRRPIADNDIPAVLGRWRARHETGGDRKTCGFFVPAEELRENDYVLQSGRYREQVVVEHAGQSVEELMMDIVRIDIEVSKHMRDLAAMLGMSYDEMMRRAMERPLPPADGEAGEG